MLQLLDFSSPTATNPSVVKSHGYLGIMRYLSTSAWKRLTKSECDRYINAGLGVGVVYEDGEQTVLGNGVTTAKRANEQASQAGIPENIALFYAGDYDLPVTDIPKIENFFNQVKSVGGRPPGFYGPVKVVNELLRVKSVDYGWNAGGWRHGATIFKGDLQQLVGSPIPSTDVDNVLDSNDLSNFLYTANNKPDIKKEAELASVSMVTPSDPNHPLHGIGYVTDGITAVKVPNEHVHQILNFLGISGPVGIDTDWFEMMCILPSGPLPTGSGSGLPANFQAIFKEV